MESGVNDDLFTNRVAVEYSTPGGVGKKETPNPGFHPGLLMLNPFQGFSAGRKLECQANGYIFNAGSMGYNLETAGTGVGGGKPSQKPYF